MVALYDYLHVQSEGCLSCVHTLLDYSAEVEKVSEPGNVVPRNFFGLKFSQKVFEEILRLEKNF